MANLIVSAIAEWNGKALARGQKDIGSFEKSVKNLGRALGVSLSVGAVVAFGKASVKAFAADEKAAARLTQSVKNLGLGFEDSRIKKFIGDLEKTAGVADDVLRPAFQSLLQTTGSVAKSQELLNLALDVSAGSGIDVAEVAKDLSLAYLGQTKGLAKYNTGLTKTELTMAGFAKIQEKLQQGYSGQNAARLETFAGKMEYLGVAAGNAQETIGKGLVDALMILSGDTTVEELAATMQTAAENTAKLSTNLASVIKTLNAPLNAVAGTLAWFIEHTQKYVDLIVAGDPSGFLKGSSKTPGAGARSKSPAGTAAATAARKKAEDAAIKRNKELAKLIADQAKSAKDLAKQKALQNAIDKANVALGKTDDIFNIDKIQIAAALTNQAEILGQATTFAQQLQIANDTARLRVKQDILALEDAISAKDEAAITAATAKLNKDLQILGALTGQNIKLSDIKSILDSLKPKDLINLDNLNQALAKITEMLRLLQQANTASTSKVPNSGSLGSGIPVGDYIAPVAMKDALAASTDALLEYADAATARATAFADLLDLQNIADQLALDEYMAKLGVASSTSTANISSTVPVATAADIQSGNRYAAQAANYYNITVQGSVITEQDLTQVIQNAVQQNNRYGNNLNVAGAL